MAKYYLVVSDWEGSHYIYWGVQKMSTSNVNQFKLSIINLSCILIIAVFTLVNIIFLPKLQSCLLMSISSQLLRFASLCCLSFSFLIDSWAIRLLGQHSQTQSCHHRWSDALRHGFSLPCSVDGWRGSTHCARLRVWSCASIVVSKWWVYWCNHCTKWPRCQLRI